MSASACSRTILANAASTSVSVWTLTTSIRAEIAVAAFVTSSTSRWTLGLSGWTRTAITAAFGATSRRSPSRFAPSAPAITLTPVRLPVCTENLVRIDLMRESLNVGHDGRADISLRAGIYKDRANKANVKIGQRKCHITST